MPPDLGEPDEHGVFTKQSCAGKMYFRLIKDCQGMDTWEWSIDRLLWIPTAYVSAGGGSLEASLRRVHLA